MQQEDKEVIVTNTAMEIVRGGGRTEADVRQPFKRRATEMLETPSKDDYSSSGSSSDSGEDDILLFDSLPEKPVLLDVNHPYQSVLSELVVLGLNAWHNERRSAAACPSKTIYPTTLSPTPQSTSRSVSMPVRQRKRARMAEPVASHSANSQSMTYVDEVDSDESDTVTSRPHKRPGDLMACPFYRFDPARHGKCLWELDLHHARSVTQHVIVDHRLPPYCPVCYLVFDRATGRDIHIVSRSCTKSESPMPQALQGVSESQVKEISRPEAEKKRRNARKMSWSEGRKRGRGTKQRSSKAMEQSVRATDHEAEQWFDVWDILFPCSPRPESSYLSAPEEREVVSIRRFWRRDGPEMVAKVLEGHGMLRWEDLDEEAALATLHASVLEGMLKVCFPSQSNTCEAVDAMTSGTGQDTKG
jgi:hypothetical protein